MEDEFKKMITGKIYYGASTELLALQSKADEIKAALDAIPLDQRVERHKAMTDLFGSVDGPCIVKPPFTVEFGCNIHLGAGVFINNGATFMESAPIKIGERTAIGPNVQFITPGHPVRPEDRFTESDPDAFPPYIVHNIAQPITIGAYVWVGAGAS